MGKYEIYDTLKKHGQMDINRLVKITGITNPDHIRRILQKLRYERMVERIPTKRRYIYRAREE